MAAGVSLGQVLGGGGGRGIESFPGEGFLHIRRNQATKHGFELAREATDKLTAAQDRLSNDLRVHFCWRNARSCLDPSTRFVA